MGATAFSLNLVIGARLRVVDQLFGGLDKMYRFHRVNGRVVYILIAVHAALILISRGTVSSSLVWNVFSPTADVAVFLGVVAFAGLTVGIGLTLYVRLAHEMFVYVQRSLGLVFVVASFHMFLIPGAKALSPLLRAYMALLVAAGLAAWCYRSLFASVLVRRHDFMVTAVRRLDPTVVEITMSPHQKALRFLPGQFVYVTFYSSAFAARFHPISLENEGEFAIITFRPGDIGNQFHPFSITSADGESELRVTVKAVGDFTSALQELDRGAAAKVEGPYGGFSYRRASSRRQVWIAGGIGVTPFLSMARSLDEEGFEVDLFYGMKTRSQAYFIDELEALSERNHSLRITSVPEDEEGFIDVRASSVRAGISRPGTSSCAGRRR